MLFLCLQNLQKILLSYSRTNPPQKGNPWTDRKILKVLKWIKLSASYKNLINQIAVDPLCGLALQVGRIANSQWRLSSASGHRISSTRNHHKSTLRIIVGPDPKDRGSSVVNIQQEGRETTIFKSQTAWSQSLIIGIIPGQSRSFNKIINSLLKFRLYLLQHLRYQWKQITKQGPAEPIQRRI